MSAESLTRTELLARFIAHRAEVNDILAEESIRLGVATVRLDEDGKIVTTVDMTKLTGVILGAALSVAYDGEYASFEELTAEVEREQLRSILGDVDLG